MSASHEIDLRLEPFDCVSNSKIIPIYSLAQLYNTMTDYTTLPLQAHDDRSLFLDHAWNIGRAYRNQAIELISICQFVSRLASPKLLHEDAELRRWPIAIGPCICRIFPSLTFSCRIRRACDLALQSAADSGWKATDKANALFKEATEMLGDHSERRLPM